MKIETRNGSHVLLDDDGVPVALGDQLCEGNLTYYFGGVIPDPHRRQGLMVALREWPEAEGWKATIRADDPSLYRGPPIADLADLRCLIAKRVKAAVERELRACDAMGTFPSRVGLKNAALRAMDPEVEQALAELVNEYERRAAPLRRLKPETVEEPTASAGAVSGAQIITGVFGARPWWEEPMDPDPTHAA